LIVGFLTMPSAERATATATMLPAAHFMSFADDHADDRPTILPWL